MKITIVGAGSMGCLYGAHLARIGHQIAMVDVRDDVIQAITDRGLELEGVSGSVTAAAAATSPDAATGPVDLVIVQAHSSGSSQAARVAGRVLGPKGFAITLQNGIGNVEALVDVLGSEQVLGGISYNSASSNGPGQSQHTNAGPTWIGELDGTATERVAALAATFEAAGLATTVSDNIIGVIWDKFVHNCAINPVAAVAGLRANQVSQSRAADALQDRLLEELLALVRAKGVTLVEEDPVEAIKETCRRVTVKPSMLQHVEAGLATEIAAQNGAAIREGRALGLEMPYNEAVTLMVTALTDRAGLQDAALNPS